MSQLQTKGPDFPRLLEVSKSQIANALPKHMDASRMLRIALTEFRKNPKLQECDPTSILKCIVETAQLGLEPGINGEAYLVPYGKECTLIPGYRGLMKNARKSPEVSKLDAYAIYEGDEFEITLGIDPSIVHKPKFKSTKAILYYAFCKMANGDVQFVVRTREQIEKHRDRYSKQANGQAWRDSFDEMALKTVLRNLCKRIPASIELVETLEYEAKTYEAEVVEQPDPEKRQEVLDAPEVLKDSETEVIKNKFKELSIAAAKAEINTDTLYNTPQQALEELPPKGLRAINIILQHQLDKKAVDKK